MNDADSRFEAMFAEYQDTKIICDENAEEMLTGYFFLERIHSIMFFTAGASSVLPDSAFQRILRGFGESEFDYSIYGGIPAEPAVDDVRNMCAELKTVNPDCVVAVGGGSVLDAAKAANLSWQSGIDVAQMFGVNKVSSAMPDKKFKRVVCVPTTAGTGSEATQYSNIVDPAANVKKLIVEDAVVPEIAFISPCFTRSMPKALTVTTALDALVHCIESLLNPAPPEAAPSAWALEGVRLIAGALPRAAADPEDAVARRALGAAAALGGMCIRRRPTSLPHLASFSLYGKVSHGNAVAALLPAFWRFYISGRKAAETTMRLAGIFARAPEKTPGEVVASYEEFVRSVGALPNLAELPGIERSVIAKIAADAVLNPVKLASCPRKIETAAAEDIISGILEKAWQS